MARMLGGPGAAVTGAGREPGRPRTLFEKAWDTHVIRWLGDGEALLHVDRHWLNDGGYNALAELDRRGLAVRNPELTFAVLDHLVETTPGRTYASRIPNGELWAKGTVEGCRRHGIALVDLDDPRHGITHVISPEMGLTLPGSLIACTDSHTCTNGAFGALAIGIGSAGGTQVLATQTLIVERPRQMRISFVGRPDPAATAKDVVLHAIGLHSSAGALGHAVELAGPAIEAMTMPERMTVCNMGVEMGATTAIVAPDERTFEFLEGREHAPRGADWERALAAWRELRGDEGAHFDAELAVDVAGLGPRMTWGTSPEHVIGIEEAIPDPAAARDEAGRRARRRALEYMDLRPGRPLAGLPIDAAFIGSCTNARIDDLREAAAQLRGRRVADGVRAICIPGSADVARAAAAEGLDDAFRAAGFEWGESGCAMCTGAAADRMPPGSRIVSSTNRNYENRQGPGVRTHLASPATVAASAVAGALADVRGPVAA